MARQNKPTMLNPLDTVRKVTDQTLGIPSTLDTDRRIAALERAVVLLTQRFEGTSAPSSPLAGASMDDILGVFEYITPGIVHGRAVKGSVTATVVTSTTGTTIVNFNLGPLVKGVPYLVFGDTLQASNADPTSFIIAMLRIVNSGSGTDGMRTGTASGERSLNAPLSQIVIGDGTSINIAGRSRVLAGTGSVNDASVWAVGIPLNFSVIT